MFNLKAPINGREYVEVEKGDLELDKQLGGDLIAGFYHRMKRRSKFFEL